MFKELSELIPENGTIRMVLTKKKMEETREETLTLAIVPDFGNVDASIKPKLLVPLSVTGSAEEIDERLLEDIEAFTPAMQELTSTVDAALASAKVRKAQVKKKADKSKPKVTKAEEKKKALDERRKAEVNEEDLKWLESTPATDGNFVSALSKASLPTLERAIMSKETNKTNRTKIANEIAKFSDKTGKDVLAEALIELYKNAQNGTAAEYGKQLEKASGKTLVELGLAKEAPKQFSML